MQLKFLYYKEYKPEYPEVYINIPHFNNKYIFTLNEMVRLDPICF